MNMNYPKRKLDKIKTFENKVDSNRLKFMFEVNLRIIFKRDKL